jgi:hypothetical protein
MSSRLGISHDEPVICAGKRNYRKPSLSVDGFKAGDLNLESPLLRVLTTA